MMNTFRNSALTVLALAGLVAAPAAHAQTTFTTGVVTPSLTAPTLNTVISQPDFSGTPNPNQDYTNNGGFPGQTFTIGASPIQLSAVTFKNAGGASFNIAEPGATFTLEIASMYNYGYSITPIDYFTYSSSALTGTGEYFTFDTTQANLVLNANTQYFAGVESYDKNGNKTYYGLAGSATDVYSGGFANRYNSGNHFSYDRTFFISAAPEPSQWAALLVGGLGLGLLSLKARRRAGLTA